MLQNKVSGFQINLFKYFLIYGRNPHVKGSYENETIRNMFVNKRVKIGKPNYSYG